LVGTTTDVDDSSVVWEGATPRNVPVAVFADPIPKGLLVSIAGSEGVEEAAVSTITASSSMSIDSTTDPSSSAGISSEVMRFASGLPSRSGMEV